MSDQDQTEQRWASKRAWHESQRKLPLAEKIKIVIDLQHRQEEINRTKIALGLPPVPMRVWDKQP